MPSVLSLYRQRRLDRDDLELLSHLVPDLRTALLLQRHVGELRARAELAERALDGLTLAVLVLDAGASILHANQAAAALLDRADGLRAVERRLCCEREDETARLHAAVESLVAAMLHEDAPAPITLGATRGARPRPLGLLLSPLPPGPPGDDLESVPREETPHVLVTVRDPDEAQRLPVAALQQLFDLTPAQARLSAALAAGDSLESYARRCGVTLNTARSTLKSVFARTGCRRQAELVVVLTGSIAALLGPAARPHPDRANVT